MSSSANQDSGDNASKPTLFSADFCPFSMRVYGTLGIKGVDYQYVEVNLSDKPGDLLAANPEGSTPTWSHNGCNMSESLELARYVARKYRDTGPDVLPATAEDEYHMNVALKNYSDDLVQPLFGALKATDEESQREQLEKLEKTLEKLDGDLGKRGGPYFFGKDVSLVDICVFPFLERMQAALPHYRNWSIPERFSNVLRMMDAYREIPAVAEWLGRRKRASLDVHPYEKVNRVPYLIEVYHKLTTGDVAAEKAKLKGKPAPWKGKEPPADAE